MRRSSACPRLAEAMSGLASLVLIASCVACGSSGPERVEQKTDAVVGGEPSGPEEDAVVFLVATRSTVIQSCTATLVAPNLVITARHCVAEFDNKTFTCTADGELAPGSPGGTMGPLLPPEAVAIYRGAGPSREFAAQGIQIFSVQTPSICRSDIAMVLLDRNVENVPIMPMRLDAGNEPGEQIRIVGYGLDENGTFGVRHTRSGITISQVGESEFRPDADNIPPRTFLTLGSMLCMGDSGGPAFTDFGAVTAVWSQVVGDCQSDSAINYFTQIAPFEAGIVQPAFEASGYEPLPEVIGTPGSGGASAEAGAGGAETGAAAGRSDPGVGGAPGAGGAADDGGAASEPSEAGVGGQHEEPGPEYRGPRKSGGLKCELSPGGRQNRHALLLSLVIGMMLVARRVRANYRGS
jgi:hypothetical protein